MTIGSIRQDSDMSLFIKQNPFDLSSLTLVDQRITAICSKTSPHNPYQFFLMHSEEKKWDLLEQPPSHQQSRNPSFFSTARNCLVWVQIGRRIYEMPTVANALVATGEAFLLPVGEWVQEKSGVPVGSTLKGVMHLTALYTDPVGYILSQAIRRGTGIALSYTPINETVKEGIGCAVDYVASTKTFKEGIKGAVGYVASTKTFKEGIEGAVASTKIVTNRIKTDLVPYVPQVLQDTFTSTVNYTSEKTKALEARVQKVANQVAILEPMMEAMNNRLPQYVTAISKETATLIHQRFFMTPTNQPQSEESIPNIGQKEWAILTSIYVAGHVVSVFEPTIRANWEAFFDYRRKALLKEGVDESFPY